MYNCNILSMSSSLLISTSTRAHALSLYCWRHSRDALTAAVIGVVYYYYHHRVSLSL